MRLLTPETGAFFSMKYGKDISMWPSSASSFSTISRSITWKVSTVISRSCASRISTKRDMCVPLKWCGRPTYMLNSAMVCCASPERSWMRTGWRMALMPTLSMASLRESRSLWTSGMLYRSLDFIGGILSMPADQGQGTAAALHFHLVQKAHAQQGHRQVVGLADRSLDVGDHNVPDLHAAKPHQHGLARTGRGLHADA